jgi:[calcium/calmodulin-dependent protein kinase] kinase
LKISDFGVSYIIDSVNTIDGSAGSPAFMAPELLSSDQSDRKASLITADIWAAGVTLYCFVYGKLPFIGENIIEMNKKIKTER